MSDMELKARDLIAAGWHEGRRLAPRPLPVSALIREARHPDWRHFLVA